MKQNFKQLNIAAVFLIQKIRLRQYIKWKKNFRNIFSVFIEKN